MLWSESRRNYPRQCGFCWQWVGAKRKGFVGYASGVKVFACPPCKSVADAPLKEA